MSREDYALRRPSTMWLMNCSLPKREGELTQWESNSSIMGSNKINLTGWNMRQYSRVNIEDIVCFGDGRALVNIVLAKLPKLYYHQNRYNCRNIVT